MAPKKGKKISLNEFLGDSTLGSWADEMDSLPNAPAPKIDEEPRTGDHFHSRRDDSSRQPAFAREDVPLPTQPPYTAFVGNLAFDLTEDDIATHFSDLKINSVKIIRDKEDRPKGFGYVEFDSLDGLKSGLARTGSSLSGRTIRVSVAEPPKERSSFAGGAHEDDAKFSNPWRRDGPLPDLPEKGRRRFEGSSIDRAPSVPDTVSDWRSQRPSRLPDNDTSSFRRKPSSNFASESNADKEETWSIGSKFKPSTQDEPPSRFGSVRSKPEMFAGKETSAPDEGDWRSGPRMAKSLSRNSGSPTSSTPPTPQLSRRKLELLPRSGNVSTSPSPLSSPKMSPASQPSSARPNPFGAAKPVDVSQREKQVEEKIEKDRELHRHHAPMSRTNSRTASERTPANRVSTPPPSKPRPASPKPISAAATVRPALSFANVAANKKTEAEAGETTDQAPESSA